VSTFWTDVFPLLVFFVMFKTVGIYEATAAVIVLSVLGAFVKYRIHRRVDPLPLFGTTLMVVFGGLTIYLKEPKFLIWKPTLAYLATAAFFALSTRSGREPLVKKLLGGSMRLADRDWWHATWAYAGFFAFMAVLNLVLGHVLDFNTWVNFKVWGTILLSFGFMFSHAHYLSLRQLPEESADSKLSEGEAVEEIGTALPTEP
jgi:intracellular septation protein